MVESSPPADPSPAEACPRCGAPRETGTGGLCPRCLLAMNLRTMTLPGSMLDSDRDRLHPPSLEEMSGRFPQFEFLEYLGRGGMGIVYKARQKALDRLIAIKILAGEWQHEPGFAERFVREAKTLARLAHPHIVTVHDFGEQDGLYYLVMEYVDGVNLRDLLRDGKLEPQQALAIVPPVCEALQYAHSHGVIHRDIKPENLLLDREGRIKIADFGIAAMAGELPDHSGTPAYMAPEQSSSSPLPADHLADIYSLGAVLYEMLTGKLPPASQELAAQKITIDVRIDEIVLRALAARPELRFQSAGEMAHVVRTVAATHHAETAHAAAAASPLSEEDAARLLRGPRRLVTIGLVGFLACLVVLARFIELGPQSVTGSGIMSFLALSTFVGMTVLGWWALAGIRRARLRRIPQGLLFLGMMEALLFPIFILLWVVPPLLEDHYAWFRVATHGMLNPSLLAMLLLGLIVRLTGRWARGPDVSEQRLSGKSSSKPTGKNDQGIGILILCLMGASFVAMACHSISNILFAYLTGFYRGPSFPGSIDTIWQSVPSVLFSVGAVVCGRLAILMIRFGRPQSKLRPLAAFNTLCMPLIFVAWGVLEFTAQGLEFIGIGGSFNLVPLSRLLTVSAVVPLGSFAAKRLMRWSRLPVDGGSSSSQLVPIDARTPANS